MRSERVGTCGYYPDYLLCRVICEREDGRHSGHPAVKGGGVRWQIYVNDKLVQVIEGEDARPGLVRFPVAIDVQHGDKVDMIPERDDEQIHKVGSAGVWQE